MAASGVALAQPAAPGPQGQAALSFTVYTARDGLSDEVWTALGFDHEGFVWGGSASQIARFDGYRWTLWPQVAARSLVRDLRADPQGRLWALFEREGLAVWDGRAWTLRGHADSPIQQLSDWQWPGTIATLAAPTREGLLTLADDRWTAEAGPPGVQSRDIEVTHSLFGGARQWLASPQLWFRTLDTDGSTGQWQRFTDAQLPLLEITDLHRSVNRGREELWIVSYGNGLIRIDDSGIRVWREATGELPSEAMYRARATTDAQGERILWVATRGGVLRLQGERTTVYDRRHGLPSDAVRSLEIQRDVDGIDLLWVATEGGIARAALGENPWQTASLLGSRYNGVFSVLHEDLDDGGERLWVATAKDGLGVREDGRWRVLTHTEGTLPVEGFRQIWRLPGVDGRAWRLASANGSLWQVDDALQFSQLATPWDGQDDGAMHAISRLVDGVREYWFLTRNSGIFQLRGSRWTRHAVDDGIDTGIGFRLAEQIDRSGHSWLWAATERGLLRFDGKTWSAVPIEGLADAGLRTATPIDEGGRTVLWLGATRNGTLRLDVEDPTAPRLLAREQVPAPPDSTVYTILPDRNGRIYVCTNNGVQQLTPQSGGGWREQVFRRRDGMVHDECNTNAQMVDAHDRYWVGTLAGLSVFDPRVQTPQRDTRPRDVRFTALQLDEIDQPLDPGAGVMVPPATRQLRIDYTLLVGQRETETVYRSQLLGLDAAPGPWSDEHSRSYSRLPPGSYELQVEARDYAGTLSRSAALSIKVQPQWHERHSVRIAGALLLMLSGIALAWIYNRSLRRRQLELERIVAQRTGELSTANQRLVGLSYIDALTGVANRRRFDEALDAAVRRARDKQLAVGVIVIDVDRFKNYNDRFGHPVGDIALKAIATALQTMARPQDVLARYGGEEFVCLVVDATPDGVQHIAEEMRNTVGALAPAALGNDSVTLTLSAGLVCRIPTVDDRAEDLMHEADAALYRAKQDGRNCVRVGRAAARD